GDRVVVGFRKAQVIHQHPMIANATVGIARHAIEPPRESGDPDLDPTLFLDLAPRGVHRRLAEIHEAAGQAPASLRRWLAAANEQHAAAREHDGTHADTRIVGILTAHAISPMGARARSGTCPARPVRRPVLRRMPSRRPTAHRGPASARAPSRTRWPARWRHRRTPGAGRWPPPAWSALRGDPRSSETAREAARDPRPA